ncbi:MAG: DUF302 domain-containing protein [Halocynthiibacter sp.]
MKRLIYAAAFIIAAPVFADGMITYESPDDFDDTNFALESAIIGTGIKINDISHVSDMLQRTKEDVGGTRDIFEHAEVYSFCSANLSRKVMEADPMNLVHCPYNIFIAQTAGTDKVIVGYREMPAGPMKEVEALLDGIAKEAIGE